MVEICQLNRKPIGISRDQGPLENLFLKHRMIYNEIHQKHSPTYEPDLASCARIRSR